MEDYQGGFSDEVYKTDWFQDYIHSPVVAGYIGSEKRSIKRDRELEIALRNVGLEENGIAMWLTSTSARHMMDSVDQDTSIQAFRKIILPYTDAAFLEVAIWAHPDHKGSLASTKTIRTWLAYHLAQGANK